MTHETGPLIPRGRGGSTDIFTGAAPGVECVFLACCSMVSILHPAVIAVSAAQLTVLELRKSVKSPICMGKCISTGVPVVSTIHLSRNGLLSLRMGVISTSRYLMNMRTALAVSRPSAANSFKVAFARTGRQ